jgi:hypothetical protein
MKALKEIVFVVTPYIVVSAVMYLMGSFLSASWNPEDWERVDRMFCIISAWVFGSMLLIRLTLGRKHGSD